MRNMPRTRSLGNAAILVGLIAPSAAAQTTPVEELVMYTIEDETHKLYRFVFATNTFQEIAVVRDEATETPIEDTEAMSFIPSGPYRGFYTSANSTAPSWMNRRLIKVNAVDGTAHIFDYPGGSATFIGYIRGSTPFEDGAGNWKIYGAQTRNSGTECRLVVIDPATGHLEGAPLEIRDAAAPMQWVVCEGLATNTAGDLFAVEHRGDGAGKRTQLWQINRATGRATRIGGRIPFKRVECLELAYGDGSPPTISGLPSPADSWDSTTGVMLGYSDNDDAFLIFNAGTGAYVNFTTLNGAPIAFTALDVECMVIMTQLRDTDGDLTGGFD